MLKESFLSKEYLVSDDGYVLSKRGKPLKPSINHSGYEIVNLMVNGKRIGVSVHTLVVRAFCDGYKDGYTVNHKNGKKTCNKSWNLEWVTPLENTRHSIEVFGNDHSGKNNHNAKVVRAINKETKEEVARFDCFMDAAKWLKESGCNGSLRRIQQHISRVATGLRKSYHSYIWQY